MIYYYGSDNMVWNKYKNIKDACSWLAEKTKLIELKENSNKKEKIDRGGIYIVNLGIGNIGSELNRKRPCLIISNDHLNRGDTVVIAPLISKSILNESKNENSHFTLFKSKYTFLKEDSCIMLEEMRCVDKVRINEKIGYMKWKDLDLLKNKIMYAMGYK